MAFDHFFWLHIKKSAGETTRVLLKPYYAEVDRIRRPKTFIQALPREYNDILNNYRVVLGEYQFRRALFAKTFLYPQTWDRLFSFAFAREPTDRCVSMFYYLFWRKRTLSAKVVSALRIFVNTRRLCCSTYYAFDAFLDSVARARESDSVFEPLGLHFSTHTASMWDDVTDLDGKVVLTKVYRLNHLVDGINEAFEACGLKRRAVRGDCRVNMNKERGKYQPSRDQIRKIETIYKKDFELYENLAP